MRSQIIMSIVIVVILTMGVIGILSQGVKKRYQKEVTTALGVWSEENPEILTEEDLKHLPTSVQKYIQNSGAVGQPKIWNFRVALTGQMKSSPESGWMKIKTYQYNFVKNPVRMFYIEASMFGIPVYGIHAYKSEEGIMNIRLLGLVDVVNVSGEEMNISDTVTIFNDMCFMAPGTLIDKRITWESIDPMTTKATFKNGRYSIEAILTFNEKGELVNFVSDDRYAIDKVAEKLKWSTPAGDYKQINGINIFSTASTVWHRENENFTYANFNLENIEYNVSVLK